jgi:hypothetical protein
MIGTISLLAVVGLLFYGGISRLTHGRFTPAFYAYQVDRAPENASTVWIPCIDLTLGTLALLPRARPYALGGFACMCAIGVQRRLAEGKPAAADLAMLALALTAWGAEMGTVLRRS